MTLDLKHWREQYVDAVRANQIPALRSLALELNAYLRDCRSKAPSPLSSPDRSASWQELCALAQNEMDPDKLMDLVGRINDLLLKQQSSHRR
jgi:hypothetical protein